MDDQKINKLIGYAIMAIIAYYLLQMVVPFLISGVVGLVVWRIIQEFQNRKH
jgi:predicted PurR-regulated permease PerM